MGDRDRAGADPGDFRGNHQGLSALEEPADPAQNPPGSLASGALRSLALNL